MYSGRHITVIIPALNEAPSIARVLESLRELQVCRHCKQVTCLSANKSEANGNEHCIARHEHPVERGENLIDRIIVCDNGSTDDTAALAAAGGAMVTHEPERGYGAACLAALAAPVEKDIVVFVDADHSVVATELPALVDPILNGADLVIGSRTLGHTERGALSVPQQFGNALASFLIRKLWSANVTDLGPFRATTQSTLNELQMSDKNFGWTVEMQVRALQHNKVVTEVPVSTMKRIGQSKISGTVSGVIGAARGILGTIFKLYLSSPVNTSSPQLRSGEQ